MTDLVGSALVLAGSMFLFSAGLGLVRMPDAYNRLQAGTKASTLGAILVLAGVAVLNPAWSGKLLLLIFFIIMTNPVSSHALARATHSRRCLEAEVVIIDQLQNNDRLPPCDEEGAQ
jgi:multicomponent Na+:H+ antiporter subunit G